MTAVFSHAETVVVCAGSGKEMILTSKVIMVIQSLMQVIIEVNRFFSSSSCQEVGLHAIPPFAKLQDP